MASSRVTVGRRITVAGRVCPKILIRRKALTFEQVCRRARAGFDPTQQAPDRTLSTSEECHPSAGRFTDKVTLEVIGALLAAEAAGAVAGTVKPR
jgi:hypothetical protein